MPRVWGEADQPYARFLRGLAEGGKRVSRNLEKIFASRFGSPPPARAGQLCQLPLAFRNPRGLGTGGCRHRQRDVGLRLEELTRMLVG